MGICCQGGQWTCPLVQAAPSPRPPCSAEDGERQSGDREEGGAVTGESAEAGVGGAAQVQSPLLSDGALKLGRRKELHSVGEVG